MCYDDHASVVESLAAAKPVTASTGKNFSSDFAYLVDTKIDIKRFVTSILSVHNRTKTLSNYDLLRVTFITICCKILEGKLW